MVSANVVKRLFYRKKILSILALAFLLRFALFCFVIVPNEKVPLCSDALSYHFLAVNLLEHRVFSMQLKPPFTPNLSRTPLYPLFLSASYLLSRQSTILPIFFQLIMSTLTVFVIYKLGTKLLNEATALVAAFLLAIDPASIVYSCSLWTETFFTLLLVSSIYFLISSLRGEGMVHLVISGSFLGLATLTRPISLYFPIVLIPVFIYSYRKHIPRLLARSAIFLIVFIIPLSFWMARNYRITGKPILSTIQDMSLLHYKAVPIMADVSGDHEATRKKFGEKRLDLINNPEEYEANVRFAKKAILSHPVAYMKIALKGHVQTFLSGVEADPQNRILLGEVGTDGGLKRYVLAGSSRVINAFFMPLLYSVFAYGVFLLGKNGYYFLAIFVLLLILYFTVLPAGIESYARFRVPIMPYICLISGLGIAAIRATIGKPAAWVGENCDKFGVGSAGA